MGTVLAWQMLVKDYSTVMNDSPSRYYLNVLTQSGAVRDTEDSELSSLEDARAEAIEDAGTS